MIDSRIPRIALGFALAGLLPALGCGADDSGDTGGETHDHGAETTADVTATATATATATGSTTDHDHGAETTTGDHDHADSSGGTTDDHSIDTDADDPIVAYCACMLNNCHDQYHGTWGEDHIAAEEACMMAAEALPTNGAPIEMGNFLECRQHFCDAAAADEALCENAIGNAVCI